MPGAAPDTLRDRWLHWRNRTLASPRFQRLAAAFPLTRPIAQRRASALFDIVAGFV
jgi:demethylspheroidene O-methyltransferase